MIQYTIEQYETLNAEELERRFVNLHDLAEQWKKRLDDIRPLIEDPELGKMKINNLEEWIKIAVEQMSVILQVAEKRR